MQPERSEGQNYDYGSTDTHTLPNVSTIIRTVNENQMITANIISSVPQPTDHEIIFGSTIVPTEPIIRRINTHNIDVPATASCLKYRVFIIYRV